MSKGPEDDRVRRELSDARDALGGMFNEGVEERVAAFQRAHFELPATPPEVLRAGVVTHLEWIVRQCLGMYNESTKVSISAAIQAFDVFLGRDSQTQRFLLEQLPPRQLLLRAAPQGSAVFEQAMRHYLRIAQSW